MNRREFIFITCLLTLLLGVFSFAYSGDCLQQQEKSRLVKWTEDINFLAEGESGDIILISTALSIN